MILAGDKNGEGKAYGNIGICHEKLGDFHKAIEYGKKHQEIAQQTGKSRPIRTQYDLSVDIVRLFAGDVRGEGNAHYNISNAFEATGDLTSAIQHMQLAKACYVRCFGAGHSEVIDAQQQVERLQAQQ